MRLVSALLELFQIIEHITAIWRMKINKYPMIAPLCHLSNNIWFRVPLPSRNSIERYQVILALLLYIPYYVSIINFLTA
jgi:hypothetical protein